MATTRAWVRQEHPDALEKILGPAGRRALKSFHRRGGLVAGTSAGAACAGKIMITGGMRDERWPDVARKTGISDPALNPTRQELWRYYCAGTGRDLEEFDYFAILASFKTNCIIEYKVAQAAAGKLPMETGRWFAEMVEEGFKRLAEYVRRIS